MAIRWGQSLGKERINLSLTVCERCASFWKEKGSFDGGKEGSKWWLFPVNSWQGVSHSKLSKHFSSFSHYLNWCPWGRLNIQEAEPHFQRGRAACGVKWTAEHGLEMWAPLPTLQNQCEPEKSNYSLDRRFLNPNNNFWDYFGFLLFKRQICGVNVLFNSGFLLRCSSINTSS